MVSLASAKTQSPSYWRTSCSRPDSTGSCGGGILGSAGWRGWGWAFVGGFAPVWPSVPIVLPLVCVCVCVWGWEEESGKEERGTEKLNYALNASMCMYRQVSYHGKMKDELLSEPGPSYYNTHTSHGITFLDSEASIQYFMRFSDIECRSVGPFTVTDMGKIPHSDA